jgi:hypothetical protein
VAIVSMVEVERLTGGGSPRKETERVRFRMMGDSLAAGGRRRGRGSERDRDLPVVQMDTGPVGEGGREPVEEEVYKRGRRREAGADAARFGLFGTAASVVGRGSSVRRGRSKRKMEKRAR